METFKTPLGPAEKLQSSLVRGQQLPVVGPVFRMVAKFRGVQIPPHTFDAAPHIAHVGPIVVHEKTRFGRNVTLFHNVTIGRGNVWEEPHPDFAGFEIQDHAVLCAGAVVIGTREKVTVGEGTVVGANVVLTRSTGSWEIWAGSPARKVGERHPMSHLWGL